MRRGLANAEPSNATDQRNLGIALEHIAGTHLLLGDTESAKKPCLECHAIFKKLAAEDPGSAEARMRAFLVGCFRLGDVAQQAAGLPRRPSPGSTRPLR